MSENAETKSQNEGFIPFRQSTPIHGGWQQRRNYNQGGYQNRNLNGGGGFRGSGGGGYNNNRWNNSRGNSSFEVCNTTLTISTGSYLTSQTCDS